MPAHAPLAAMTRSRLRGNKIDDDGCEFLSDALRTNTKLAGLTFAWQQAVCHG